VFLDKKSKTITTTKLKSNIKTLAGDLKDTGIASLRVEHLAHMFISIL